MTDLSVAKKLSPYKPKNKVRFVTAASLFDGHDASINIMRRILQSTGSEVIHLGHNRSVQEIVNAALQEDVQGIAITSYQGGHVEFFKYMIDLLKANGGANIKVFGGGGGVIVPSEIRELHAYGVTRIYAPEDGVHMGLQGMINEVVQQSDFDVADEGTPGVEQALAGLQAGDKRLLARLITLLENGEAPALKEPILKAAAGLTVPVLGITGTGGAGKSSLTDEIVRRFRLDQGDTVKIGLISIDPSRKRTGGALLGDRIRMNAIEHPNIFMRSLATRDTGSEISVALPEVIAACKLAGFDLVIVETSGIGQGNAAIVPFVDVSMYVMTPEFGAASQLEKIDMLDFADFVAINKFDRKGAEDALRDVRKQYQRNRELFTTPTDEMPVFGTQAARFNDDGVTALYQALVPVLAEKGLKLQAGQAAGGRRQAVVNPARHRAGPARPLSGRDRRQRARLSRAYGRAGQDCARAPVAAHRQGHFCRLRQVNRGFRRSRRLEGWATGCQGQETARHVAGHGQGVFRRRIRGSHPRQGDSHPSRFRIAVRHQDPQGDPAEIHGRRRDAALPDEGERPRFLPLHCRRLRLQARGRGSDADVRRRG